MESKPTSYDVRLISVVSRTDTRTVAKVLRGQTVRPMCLVRINEALVSLGLATLLPELSKNEVHG